MSQDIFVRKNDKPKPSFAIGVILNKRPTKGTVGIEIEVEGKHLPKYETTPPPWMYHEDGSLRGEENGEYVLAKPIEFNDVQKALDTLWEAFKENKSRLDESNRTSVHIHLNCQNFHLNRLTSFAALYFTFEEVLTKWCGEHRVGNLFCLMAKDAPAIVTSMKHFILNDGNYPINQKLHYGALNLHALHKYGSIEIRTLRGCSDPDTIRNWVCILQRFYEISADFADPREICAMFSANGPLLFFDSILGDKAELIRSGIEMNNDQIADSMYEGIRMAQDLCFCRDWSLVDTKEIKSDPFGRDKRKVAKKLMNFQPTADYGPSFTEYMAQQIALQEMPNFTEDEGHELEPEYDDLDLPEEPTSTSPPIYGHQFPWVSSTTTH